MSVIPSDFFVERADFQHDHDAINQLRVEVFELEQHVPADMLWDEADRKSVLVLARDLDQKPVGTGRLTQDGRIGRMAVLAAWRDRGVGSAMLNVLIDAARQQRLPEVRLHAQINAVPFYLAHGFTSEGEVFMEAGIQHQTMMRTLPASESADARPTPPRVESEEIELHTMDDCRKAAIDLFDRARHRLWIYSRDMDGQWMRGDEVSRALRRVATSGRGAEIQILVQDVETALHTSPLLLTLAQRLSSVILIRQPEEETELQFAGAFLLNDQGGWMARPIASRYDGEARMYAPGTHRQWMEHFKHAWDHSREATELRAQGL